MRSCWLRPAPLMSIPVLGCRKKYAMQLSAIRTTVTTGKRSVGMLSLSGNTSAGLRERADAGRVLGDVLVGCAQVLEGRDHLVVGLAQSDHQAGLRHDLAGAHRLGVAQHPQRALPRRAAARDRVQA